MASLDGLSNSNWQIDDVSVSALNGILFDINTQMFEYAIVAIGERSGGALPSAGAIVFEQTLDGKNWFQVPYASANVAVPSRNIGNISATAAGLFYIATPMFRLRARVAVALVRQTTEPFVSVLANKGAMPPLVAAADAIAPGTNLIGAEAPSASAAVGTGTTHAKVKSAAGTNLTLVKGGAGKLFGYRFRNTTATVKYAKLYNKATMPVIGTDTPIETVVIPPNGVASYLNTIGKAFSLGLGYAITGGVGEADTTAVAVDEVVGSLDFI